MHSHRMAKNTKSRLRETLGVLESLTVGCCVHRVRKTSHVYLTAVTLNAGRFLKYLTYDIMRYSETTIIDLLTSPAYCCHTTL